MAESVCVDSSSVWKDAAAEKARDGARNARAGAAMKRSMVAKSQS